MAEVKDGGPAFPQPIAIDPSGRDVYTELAGMSLRQWYAGQALAALVRSRDAMNRLNGEPDFPLERNLAESCFALADAMIEQGNK